MDKMPPQPRRMSITESANGGFIVRPSGDKTFDYNAAEEVYPNLDSLKGCVEKHFSDSKGKSKES